MLDVKEGDRVRCHMNLRDKSFTVSRYIKGKGWRKACAAQRVYLKGVEFKVSEKGRERAVREGRRNVHAYAYGILTSWIDAPIVSGTQIRYNPFHAGTFVDEFGTPVYIAKKVLFSMKFGVQAWGINVLWHET